MNTRYARAESPASMGRRFGAGLLDAALWLAVGGTWLLVGLRRWALAAPSTPAADDAALLVQLGVALSGALILAQWFWHGRYGWTLGRLAVGVRTLDVEVREPIGMPRVLVRALVIAAGALVAGIGALVVLCSPFFDRTRRNRGWQDRAARDEVLDVRSAPDVSEPPRPARAATPAVAAPRRPAPVPDWAFQAPAAAPGHHGPLDDGGPPSLVLAPVSPTRSGPDLDTRAIPFVVPGAAPGLGLDPELELTRPALPRELLEPEPPEEVGAQFELSDGRRVTVERTALVGRNPASDDDVQLVCVADPTRSVSKTHLQIGVERSGVWVADRGSTNGTVVTLPDGGQVICRVDQQVRLRVGSTVVFGDSSMRLVRVPGATPAA